MEKTDIANITDTADFYRWLGEREEPTQEKKYQRIQLELPVPEMGYNSPQTVTTDNSDTDRGVCIIDLY